MTTIRELFVKLGVRTEKKDWDRADKLIGGARKGLLALTGAASGAVTGLFLLVRQVSQVGDELAKTAISLQIGVEELQEWRFVAERSGLAAGTVERSLLFMGRALINNAGAFKQLGITAAESMPKGELFQKTIEGLAGIADETKRAELVSKLFSFRQAQEINKLIAAAGSIDELRKRKRELGIITGEGAASSEKFADTLTDFRHALMGAKNEIGVGLMPTIGRLIDRFTTWFILNKKLINQKIEVFIEKIGNAIEKVEKGFDKLERFLDRIGGLENLAKILGIALLLAGTLKLISIIQLLMPIVLSLVAAFKLAGIAGVAAAAIPLLTFFAVAVAILAVILLVDDLITTFRGGDSVIRRFWEITKQSFEDWQEWFASWGQSLKELWESVSNWLSDTFNRAIEGVKTGASEIVQFWKDAFANLGDYILGIFDRVTARFDAIKEGIKSLIPGLGRAAKSEINTAAPKPLAPRNNAVGQTTNNNITIGPASASFSGSINNMNERQLAMEMQRSQENVLDFQLRKALESFAGGEV